MEGTVVNAQGGEPMKKAIIQAISEEHSEGEARVYSAVSDAEGRFSIAPVDPGRYRVFVERTGFIQTGEHHRRSEGIEVSVSRGQQVKGIVLRVLPAAAVTGRVVDEDGDPMPNLEVSVARIAFNACRRQLETAGSARTNDLGEYRIGGLAPARYFVWATPPPEYSRIAERPKSTSKPDYSYVTIYYPGATDPSQAAPLELHPGEDMPIDFSLVRTQTFRIRGTVLGMQLANATGSDPIETVIARRKMSDSTFSQGEVDKDGNFEIRGLAPGTYSLSALTTNSQAASAAQTIEISNSDLNDIRIAAAPMSQIRGRLRIEGQRAPDLASFHVSLEPLEADSYTVMIGAADGNVNRDGSFRMEHVSPGTYEVLLEGKDGYFVKSVLVGGHDVSATGLSVAGPLLGVEVVAMLASAQIDGWVQDSSGAAVPNVMVVAVPSSAHRDRADRYRTALTDQHGHFQMPGLRPDHYTVLAWDDVENGTWCDPEFLKTHETSGTSADLSDGTRQSVRLTVQPTKQP